MHEYIYTQTYGMVCHDCKPHGPIPAGNAPNLHNIVIYLQCYINFPANESHLVPVCPTMYNEEWLPLPVYMSSNTVEIKCQRSIIFDMGAANERLHNNVM